jgi:hypothetical protein
MNKLSIGEDSTLGSYLKLTALFFGKDSPAVAYLKDEIAKAPNGEREEVLVDESQMVYVLSHIHFKGLA